MGIVAFSAATVIALLPSGLQSLRSSIEQTVESQISQQITAELLQTDFAGATGMTRYYDNEGFPVPNPEKAIFTAVVTPVTTIDYPGSDQLKDLPTPLNQSLKVFNVNVTSRTSAQGDPRLQTAFSLYLARREKLP